jgi:hypothetical protein
MLVIRHGRDNRGGNEASNPGMNLHVSGLSREVTADDLNKRFNEVGTVSRGARISSSSYCHALTNAVF